jgi:hypothetical protein
VGEDVPDVRGERAWPAEGGEWVGAAVDAVPDADAGLAGCGGEGPDRDAGLGGDVFEAAVTFVVLLAEPVRVDGVVRGRGRAAEPGAGEELPDDALAASGDAGDLAGAVSLSDQVAELFGAGWVRFRRWRAQVRRTVRSSACRPATDACTGSPWAA